MRSIMNSALISERPAPLPLVICVAPNGARRTQRDHAELPIAPYELAREAVACVRAGASVMHLHVRDERGEHSLDTARYRDALAAINDAVGDRLLVQVTTEAVGRYNVEEQLALLEQLRPALASFALRELSPSVEDESAVAGHLARVRSAGVVLQYILYTPEEARRLAAWVERGWIAEPDPNVLFVLGRYTAGQRSSPADLLPFLEGWPLSWPWSVCAFGATEAQCMAVATGLGGHVRVGFENNLWRGDGRLAANNAELVANVASLALAAGRPLAEVGYARQVFGLSPSM